MSASYKVGLGILSLVLAACAGAKHPPEQAAKLASPAPLRVDATKPELSQVAAPKELVLIARAERLDSAAATLARWMNLPFDLRMLDALGPGLSQSILADAPVEAAVALAEPGDAEVPQPYAVFSAGIASMDAGRKLFEKFGRRLEEASPGVWLTNDESPIACGLTQALGRAQVRVVCGDRRIDVETLLPYATRGLPLQAMGTSDVHVDIMLAPIRERYEQRLTQIKALAIPMALHELGFTDARLSRPITDILYALGDEIIDVINDLDRISIDSRLVQNPDRVELSAALDFAHAHSWTAQTLASATKGAAPAPLALFDLPRDSTLASYVTSQNPKSYENLVHRLSALIDGVLSHLNVNAKLRDEFSRSLDQFNAARTSSAACGAVPALSDSNAQDSKVSFVNSLGAWQLCVYDRQSLSSFSAVFDAAVRIFTDPSLRKAIGERALSFRRRALEAGLPAGTIGYELRVDSAGLASAISGLMSEAPAAPKLKEKSATPDKPTKASVYIYLMPDGDRTWIGTGTDLKSLVSHLIAERKAAPDTRLGALPDLAWLRGKSAIAGGFMTVSYLMASVERQARARGVPGLKGGNVLANAPHHGRTPIPLVWTVGGDAGAPKLQCDVRIERAVFEDLVAVSGQLPLKVATLYLLAG